MSNRFDLTRLPASKSDSGLSYDDKLIRKSSGTAGKKSAQYLDLDGRTLVLKAHQDHPIMGTPLAVDLFAEVFVVCNENPTLVPGAFDYGVVFGAPLFVVNRENFMTFGPEPFGDTGPGALVHEEAHLDGFR